MIAIIVVSIFVAACAGRAWYETRVAPALRQDLETLDKPDATEAAEFERVYGVSTGILRTPADVWDGRERRTMHTRPSKIRRPADVYDGADL